MTDSIPRTVELRVSVRASPETNDHEVCLFGDDQDLVNRFGDRSIGLDPDDIPTTPCPLSASDLERECVIGRCDCGILGCGDVRVRIRIDGELVIWSPSHGLREPVYFALHQYRSEIERALADHTWETPERTASRLISSRIDREKLADHGFKFCYASGRSQPGSMTVALWLEPGPYQVLVQYPWSGPVDLDLLANSVVSLLARPPALWPDVQWLPQAEGVGAPSIAGSGWRQLQL
jgi:hypothetical protein